MAWIEDLTRRSAKARHFIDSLDATKHQVILTIHDQHYHDGAAWQEVNESLVDETGEFAKQCNTMAHAIHIGNGGNRRWYPRRNVPTEYVNITNIQYWRTAGGGSWRNINLPTPVWKNNGADWDMANLYAAITIGWRRIDSQFILKDNTAPTRLRFAVSFVGLTYNATTGKLTSTTDGLACGRIDPPFAWCGNADRVLGTQLPVTATYDGTYIEWSVDTTGATFPVYVDPPLTIQPDATAGLDTRLIGGAALDDTNFGTDAQIAIGYINSAVAYERTLIKFDLTDLPADATIDDATLTLVVSADYSGNARTFRVFRQKRAWVEAQATWHIYSTGNNWQTEGGFGADDCEQTDIGSCDFTATEAVGTAKAFALTPTTKAALDLGNGWLLKADTESDDMYLFRSSDYEVNATLRPKLVINYTAAGLTPAEAIQAQASDAAVIQSIYPIAPAEGTQAQISDAAAIQSIYSVPPTENVQAQISDAASISFQGGGITVGEVAQLQVSDQAYLYSSYIASQGPLYPQTVEEVAVAPYNAIAWVGTSIVNISADDAAYASIVAPQYDTGTISNLLLGRNFGATVPTGATINGLLVEIGKWYSAGSARDSIVTLYNGSIIGSNLGSVDIGWPSSIATVSYGNGTHLWGTIPTPDIVNGTNFGIGMAAVASALNTDIWVNFYRLTVYYSAKGGYFGIQPSEATQAQISDAASIEFILGGQIAVAEATQAQVSDAATLAAITPIAPTEATQAQVSDPALVKAVYSIAPAEASQTQVSDAAAIKAVYPIAPAECSQVQASDATSLIVVNVVAPTEGIQAQASDAAAIKATYLLTPGEATQAQVSDAASLTQATAIAPAEATQIQASDAPTITVVYPVPPNEGTQTQTSDPAVIKAVYTFTPTEATQAQVSDAASVSFSGAGAPTIITVSEATQAQISDAATVKAIYVIGVVESAQAQISDAASIQAVYKITSGEATQSQVSDAATISFTAPTWNIAPAEAWQAQAVDLPGLGVVYVVGGSEAYQQQISDIGVISITGVFEHGERRLYELNTRSNSVFAKRPTGALKDRADLEVDD